MHCMALPLVIYVARINSYLVLLNSCLCKEVRTREVGRDAIGKFSIVSLQVTYTFVCKLFQKNKYLEIVCHADGRTSL